jgi:cytosine/adenosine deaminase-related metal-dependent hydrolase
MACRKLSASYIFSSHSGFLKNGILILDEKNIVVDLIDTSGNLWEEANLEYYNGILIPGFISTHSRKACTKNGSYSADEPLSILKGLIFIQQNDPETKLSELLSMATIKEAKSHGIDNRMGSFEKGKQPGVNLIEKADLQRMILTGKSKIKKIV